MQISTKDIAVGRVLFEDEKSMTLEILKDENDHYTLDPDTPDRFFTFIFLHQEDDGLAIISKPWERED